MLSVEAFEALLRWFVCILHIDSLVEIFLLHQSRRRDTLLSRCVILGKLVKLQCLLLQSGHSFIEKVRSFLQLVGLPLQLSDSVPVQILRTVAPNSALRVPSQSLA